MAKDRGSTHFFAALLVTCGDRQAAVSPQDLAVAAQALADQAAGGPVPNDG